MNNPLTVLDECKNKENLRTRFPASRKPYTSDYDYENDSDMEEDSDEEALDDELLVAPPVTTEKLGKYSPELVAADDSDTKNSESLDIVSVSDLDPLLSESPDTKGETGSGHAGKVIIIEDVAFVT